MGTRRHSEATRRAGAALARLLGADQAAKVMGVDRTTLRDWVKLYPSEDDWSVVSELAGAQLVERLARGEIRDPKALAVVKGVAERNRRAAELIARREAKREAEQAEPEADPVQAAVDALRDDQQDLVAAQVNLELQRRLSPKHEPSVTQGDDQQRVLDWMAAIAAMSERKVAAELKRAQRALEKLHQREAPKPAEKLPRRVQTPAAAQNEPIRLDAFRNPQVPEDHNHPTWRPLR